VCTYVLERSTVFNHYKSLSTHSTPPPLHLHLHSNTFNPPPLQIAALPKKAASAVEKKVEDLTSQVKAAPKKLAAQAEAKLKNLNK